MSMTEMTRKNYGSLISELRESLGWMGSVLANINEGVLVVHDMKALFANDAVGGMVGKPRITLLGTPIWDILKLTADGEPLQKNDYQEVLEQNNLDSLSGRYQLHEDQTLIVDITVSVIPNKDQAVFIIRNVTQQVQNEQELMEERELRTEELERSNEELESFSYSVSHDLRSPLRAISGYTSLLLDDHYDKLNEEGQEFLEIVNNETKRMGTLIDDLLTFSRLNRTEKVGQVFSMDQLVRECINEVTKAFEVDFSEIEIEDLPIAYGDPKLLRQVWINLISNAIKYQESRQKISISIGFRRDDQNDRIVFFIQDNGVGFDMKYYDKLFGVFQRLHSDDEFEGTGIGLALVRRIINRHGGEVWAESKVGEGSTFYFSLPDNQTKHAYAGK